MGGHGMNIKTSAVVKCWVRSGKPWANLGQTAWCQSSAGRRGAPGAGSRVLGDMGIATQLLLPI